MVNRFKTFCTKEIERNLKDILLTSIITQLKDVSIGKYDNLKST
jgi:hypothetical protein